MRPALIEATTDPQLKGAPNPTVPFPFPAPLVDAVTDRMLVHRHFSVLLYLYTILDIGEYRTVDPVAIGEALRMLPSLVSRAIARLVQRGYLFSRNGDLMLRRLRHHPDSRDAYERYEARQIEERARHKERVRQLMGESRNRRRAKMQNAGGRGITADDINAMLSLSAGLCVYCAEPKPLTLDHIDPISRGGQDDPDNIVACCKSCNSSKSDTPLLIWLARKRAKAA